MNRTSKIFLMTGGSLGLVAVLAGTFGAHGLRGRLSPDDLAIWETAARYQMDHALALLATAWACERLRSRALVLAGWLFLCGTMVFSGSLYVLATNSLTFGQRQPWIGMITPLGGLALIAGWLGLSVGAFRSRAGSPAR